jgi:hypothetical protein
VDPPAGAEDPAEAAVRRDQSALVRGALAALPGPTRDLIALRFWADLSHGEIAIATGLREDAVRQRIHRALQDLRRRLARVGVALSVAGVSAALESAELAATRTVPPLVAGTGMALPAAGAAALVLVTGSWWWLGHPSSGPAPSADPTTAAVAVPAPVPDPPWSLTIAADRHGITGFGSDGTRVLGMALPPDPGAPAFLLLGPDGRRRVERSGPGGGVRWPVDRPEDIAALPPWIREQLAPALSASTQPGDGPDASEALALAGLHTVSIHLAASATGALSLRAIEDGGVVFDGPIDTPDQRRGIPPRVLAHLLDGSPDFIAVGPRLGPGGVDSRSYSEHRPLPVQ